MAARKLHMPSARERIGGGAGVDGVAEGVVQNGNGVGVQPQGGKRHERPLAMHIMQPLPLAARYFSGKHDSLRPASSSALQSSWIQRLRPTSPDGPDRESGHEVHVWKDPQPPLWTSNPLLSAPPPKEPLLPQHVLQEQQQKQVDGGGDGRFLFREPARLSKGPVKISEGFDKGKRRIDAQGQAGVDIGMSSGQPKLPQQAKPPMFSSCPKVVVEAEDSMKRQVTDCLPEGNNGTSGAVVKGFGPLRVVLKPPTLVHMNKCIVAGSVSKLKGPVMEDTQGMDVYSSRDQHPGTPELCKAVLLAGTQMMVRVSSASNSLAVKYSVDHKVENEHGRFSVPPVEPPGNGFLSAPKWTLHALDNCRPHGLHPSQAASKDRTFVMQGNANGLRASVGSPPISEDYAMPHTFTGWDSGFTGKESGVDKVGKGIAPTQNFGTMLANEGRFQGARQQEAKYPGWTKPEVSGKPIYIASGAEARKGKEIMTLETSYADFGRSQQQTSQISPPFAPYQSSSHLSVGKQHYHPGPVLSPPYSGEEPHAGDEDGNHSQERHQHTSMFPPCYGPPKPRQDEIEGASGKSPWPSLFAAYSSPNQPGDLPNSNSSTGTLPPGDRLRIQEVQVPGARHSGGSRDVGNQDSESGGTARNGAHPPAPSAEARSRFDHDSSHFSSSPWPVDDARHPTDDEGSAFHSQASHTPASQVPNGTQGPSIGAKGRENNRAKYDVGGSSMGGPKDGPCKRARSREHSGHSLPDCSGRLEGSLRGPRSPVREIHASGPVKNFRPPSLAGQKDETSGSSPPPVPSEYNGGLDLRSHAFPGPVVEDRGKNRAVPSRTMKAESEADGMHFVKRLQGMMTNSAGVVRKREQSEAPVHNKLGLRRDHRDSGARLCKEVETQEAQPMVGDAFREAESKMGRQNETVEIGQKQNRLRNANDVLGEPSGPSKRSRHHLNQISWGFPQGGSRMPPEEEETGPGTEKPSGWLSRWLLAASNDHDPNAPTSAKPKDSQWNGFLSSRPAIGKYGDHFGLSGDDRPRANRAQGHQTSDKRVESRKGLRDLSSKRAVFGLSSFPTPSAAAMALVGPAARKMEPLPSQRKGPIAMWPSIHLQTLQAAEPEKPVQSSDLATYVEQS